MLRIISVRPQDEAWAVHVDGRPGALRFASGARAEEAARDLAARYARGGGEVEVRIYLRDGSLAGQFSYAADGADGPAASLAA